MSNASAMPRAKERKEIETAVLNFGVGMIVIPAASTPERGGTIVESFARPMISQMTHQTSSEKKIGIRLPKTIMSGHGLVRNR